MPYFTFDSIEHYYLEVDSQGISTVERKHEFSEIEIEQLNMIYEDTAKVLADTIMYKSLERLDFIKRAVSSVKFDTINKIFCSRSLDTLVLSTTCIPAYRDI